MTGIPKSATEPCRDPEGHDAEFQEITDRVEQALLTCARLNIGIIMRVKAKHDHNLNGVISSSLIGAALEHVLRDSPAGQEADLLDNIIGLMQEVASKLRSGATDEGTAKILAEKRNRAHVAPSSETVQ